MMDNTQFTQEELEADNFLDWSDESLGRLVRKTAARLKEYDDNGKKAVIGTAAGYMLVDAARRANAEKLTLSFTGHTHKGVETGDWRITIRLVNKANPSLKDRIDSLMSDLNESDPPQ